MQETMTHEIHDESRQGEALTLPTDSNRTYSKHVYIESYGCAMNFADSEVVASILNEVSFGCTNDIEKADVVLINTCSIREKAEERIRNRLVHLKYHKRQKPGLLIGIMGCMAERLKTDLLEEEKLVDIVVGPDAYRSLPRLIEEAETGQRSINVLLSREETYADISPIRLNSNGINAFVSIMRGCNNMCSFCVVPFTRGRERSRAASSILQECIELFNNGYREVTLLGQNVDSYYWHDESRDHSVTFAELLEMIAQISPLLRIRFSTSHPKDITDEVLFTMKKYENICKYIHLPVQSGSSRMLQMMNRTYSREWYLAKVDRIREILPGCGLSTDMIAGFCSETEEDHQYSLSLMEYCEFDLAYLYYYSERPGTLAARRMPDDVPLDIKKRRLQELVDLHRIHSLESMKKVVGRTVRVLIEGNSKKNPDEYYGRNDQNKVVVFPKGIETPGMYVDVFIQDCTAGTLIGKIINN
jgi:tRNA-2-methylthio-N6-dimethylallyladenosine synthase